MQQLHRIAAAGLWLCLGSTLIAADAPAETATVKDAEARTEKEMKPYTEIISGTDVTFDLVPIPGGVFTMGSPVSEANRNEDEGPQRQVKIEPFWMGKHEVTWDEYDIWTFNMDIQRRELQKVEPTPLDIQSDGVTRPTRPYMDMTFSMGHRGYPAISMTRLAAEVYCRWLTKKTGHLYRLPTEAEWEYACRAGTTTAYHWGDDVDKIDEYAWYFDNSDFQYQKVGRKKPNPWGLYDMHGNVSEWVVDKYEPTYFSKGSEVMLNPVVPHGIEEHPSIVRGGGWDEDPDKLRSAARKFSNKDWKAQDPQLPQSVWYFTDALSVGMRVVRPLRQPSPEEIKAWSLDPVIPEDARILGQGLYDKEREKPGTGK